MNKVLWTLSHVCVGGTWSLPWPCRGETLCRRCHWIRQKQVAFQSLTEIRNLSPLVFFSPINIYFCSQGKQNLFSPAFHFVAIYLWLLMVLTLAGFGTFLFSNVLRLLSTRGWKMTFPSGMPRAPCPLLRHVRLAGLSLTFVLAIVWGAGGQMLGNSMGSGCGRGRAAVRVSWFMRLFKPCLWNQLVSKMSS